jgi:hypothetical protein
MFVSGIRCLVVFVAAAMGADDAAGPPLKAAPDPIPIRKTRHYVVRVKLVEVDEQGRETVLGEPKLQTTGGNAGLSIDHPDGRRFDFTIRLTDRLGSNAGDELIPAKTVTTGATDNIWKKLDQKIDFNVAQVPRREVLREISKKAGISIAIDPESVRAILAEMDTPIDLKVSDESVSAVLDQLIEPINLGYVVKHDVVLIAGADKLLPSPEDFVVKSYDVADLVKTAGAAPTELPDFAPLIGRIKSSVMPASWERKDATATIRPFNSTLSITVRQTAPGHAAIERLLEKIRREQPMKVPE